MSNGVLLDLEEMVLGDPARGHGSGLDIFYVQKKKLEFSRRGISKQADVDKVGDSTAKVTRFNPKIKLRAQKTAS